jgi:glucokinase
MTQTVSAGTAACHPSTGARLVADVGGTNARFAWQAGPGLPLEAVQVLPCANYPTLQLAAHAYLAGLGRGMPQSSRSMPSAARPGLPGRSPKAGAIMYWR